MRYYLLGARQQSATLNTQSERYTDIGSCPVCMYVARLCANMEYRSDRSSGEFVEFKQAGIWLYFLREVTGKRGLCKTCGAVIKCDRGSTSGLHQHQRSRHGVVLLKRLRDDIESSSVANNFDWDEIRAKKSCLEISRDQQLIGDLGASSRCR